MSGGGGKMGGGGGGGKSGPGGNTGADAFFAQQALGQNEEAIHNRYTQLGIGQPAQEAVKGQSRTAIGPSTMEGQDIGNIPSRTGGAIGAANALLGQTFNATNAAGLGPNGPLAQLAQQQQQQSNSDFAAGASSVPSTDANPT
jgi:hypothetical protein